MRSGDVSCAARQAARAGALAIMLMLVLVSLPGASAAATVPVSLQAALFKKIFSYDKTLRAAPGGEVRVLVLEARDAENSAAALVEAFKAVGVTAEAVGEARLADRIGSASVVYIQGRAVSAATLTLCERNHVLTISGEAALAASGVVSVSVGVSGDRPEIRVNLPRARAEGHELSSELLSVAKVSQ